MYCNHYFFCWKRWLLINQGYAFYIEMEFHMFQLYIGHKWCHATFWKFQGIYNASCNNRDLPKSTLCMNSWWLGTPVVSFKKAHILVEVEMSSHLFFCKLKWAFLWLTSAVPNHQEFMQRVDLGKTIYLLEIQSDDYTLGIPNNCYDWPYPELSLAALSPLSQ